MKSSNYAKIFFNAFDLFGSSEAFLGSSDASRCSRDSSLKLSIIFYFRTREIARFYVQQQSKDGDLRQACPRD